MKAQNKLVFTKENAFVALLFLLFFPVKTQFYNATFYLFDLILNSGIVSKYYTFNYLGELVGCLEVQGVAEALGTKADVYYYIVFNFLYALSFLCGLFLIIRIKNHRPVKRLEFIILIIFSFALYNAIDYFTMVLPSVYKYLFDVPMRWIAFIEFAIILVMGIYIFFKFPPKVKFQIVFVALPMAVISFVLWFLYLGPYLLPIEMM